MFIADITIYLLFNILTSIFKIISIDEIASRKNNDHDKVSYAFDKGGVLMFFLLYEFIVIKK